MYEELFGGHNRGFFFQRKGARQPKIISSYGTVYDPYEKNYLKYHTIMCHQAKCKNVKTTNFPCRNVTKNSMKHSLLY